MKYINGLQASRKFKKNKRRKRASGLDDELKNKVP